MKAMIVPPSNISYFQRHKDVVNSKKNILKGKPNRTKETLLNLEQKIEQRYNMFESHFAQKDLFSFSQDSTLSPHKNDLLGCYKGRTSKVKDIFELIDKAQTENFLKRCPYCGITLPKTHDHYLPESDYPELAVHALNLLPCCNTCNQTKNNKLKNSSHRLFLNFYMDDIPDVQYLHVELIGKNSMFSVGAVFSLLYDNDISSDKWNIIKSHYEELKLIEAYNNEVNSEIFNVFNACVSHLQSGGKAVEGFIKNLLNFDERLFGRNHWRVVLMKALAVNTDFSRAIEQYLLKNKTSP